MWTKTGTHQLGIKQAVRSALTKHSSPVTGPPAVAAEPPIPTPVTLRTLPPPTDIAASTSTTPSVPPDPAHDEQMPRHRLTQPPDKQTKRQKTQRTLNRRQTTRNLRAATLARTTRSSTHTQTAHTKQIATLAPAGAPRPGQLRSHTQQRSYAT